MKEIKRVDKQLAGVLKDIFYKYPEWTAFLFVFTTVLWVNLSKSNFVFYYDSEIYWNLRMQFDQQQTVDFSLLNYHESLRAYLLPLIHFAISKSASFLEIRDVVFLEMAQAFMFSVLIAVIIPCVIKILFKKPINFWQIILFSSFVVFFWLGYFYYPLSDFWALFFFISGVYIFLRHPTLSWLLLIVGMLWGAAYLIRPSYVLSIFLLFFWALFYYYKYLNLKRYQLFYRFIIMVLGLMFVFWPQLMINITHFDKFSPAPQTEVRFGANLFMKQLGWGIGIQRYETFAGEESDYVTPVVRFLDPHGEDVLTKSGLGPFPVGNSTSFLTVSEYVLLVLSHPLDFFVLYLRHLFNGLDVVYNTPYIFDLYQNAIYIRLANYSIWFMVILYLIKHLKTVSWLDHRFFLVLIFTLPSILSIPTAVETRFFVSFYFIAYSIIAFEVAPLVGSFSQQKMKYLILKYVLWYIAFVSICLMLSINTFSNLAFGTYLFW